VVFLEEDPPAIAPVVHTIERRSDRNGVNRWGPGEESERRERGGKDDRRNRSRCLRQIYRGMSGGAQRAVRVRYGAVGVGMRDLRSAGNHDQQQTHPGEQRSP
jgi:hypothetical protein